jgi:hypothetical protein
LAFVAVLTAAVVVAVELESKVEMFEGVEAVVL